MVQHYTVLVLWIREVQIICESARLTCVQSFTVCQLMRPRRHCCSDCYNLGLMTTTGEWAQHGSIIASVNDTFPDSYHAHLDTYRIILSQTITMHSQTVIIHSSTVIITPNSVMHSQTVILHYKTVITYLQTVIMHLKTVLMYSKTVIMCS